MSNIIYGRNPVKVAMESPRKKPIQLYLQNDIQGEVIIKIIELANRLKIPFIRLDKFAIQKIVGYPAHHQGVVLVYEPLGSPTWKDILTKAKSKKDSLVVFVDSVEDPRNLGAILRTASAFGVDGVITSKAHTAPINSEVIKSSAGELEKVDIAQENNFTGIVKEFRENNFWMVSFEADAEMPLWEMDFSQGSWGIIVGGEDRGVRKIIRSLCDYVVSIPLENMVNSLNVSVAFGVGLYEVIRQKQGSRSC
ncbi:MAG: 23S rRNA (guanosine(2251)-2'-O)-methyltransferase RlmB [Atribacterota bacterium]|jgi:23S rRNA (guanosine2251-2'-O)-methyltransferase|nr:23S rRNA (guanosine(2251)-2'-O)-methyltransferase RlmB [Atribacterota bacterium]